DMELQDHAGAGHDALMAARDQLIELAGKNSSLTRVRHNGLDDMSLTGIQSSSVQGLLIMALLFGFGGSFISLLMSKWMALKSVGG
ncbi:hypothetical protein DP140_26650, partial [Salmonella enterica subsp. enterica serovar Weltevreden]